ncbi:filamentous hemagglutinin N-terminal domain-containing protein [Candidatus Albibeggiatoa sp. nov. BB20]|uniref:two-partner secretion domain-containing protein n=1 Tax=Candidatus Albibeggiatoa sp. nov. BB20 TaxID=3162723 RepID=UPI003365ADFE
MFRTIVWLFICLTNIVQAEISQNGNQLSINNGLYNISQDLGQTVGSNLFHSFDQFNVNQGEIAQFSGSEQIQNIISRVIGNQPSFINGTLRSTLPNADFYFLNPNGIIFGEFAQLQVPNSFHASTADYVKLSDGGEFNTRFPNQDILTTAPVASFGFLSDLPASISTQNSTLQMAENKTLSFIGGDINLTGDSPVIFSNENALLAVFAKSSLAASRGNINLVSLASQGEVSFSDNDLILNLERGGKVQFNNTLVDVSGRGSGRVLVRGGQLLMQDSTIQASTFADLDGQSIDLQLTESILIEGNILALLGLSLGSGNAGSLFLKTPNLKNTAWILSASLASGKSGDIRIEADDILFDRGGGVSNPTLSTGQSGNVQLKVTDTLTLSGRRSGNMNLGVAIYEDFPSTITTTTFSNVTAGNLSIEAKHLQLDGGLISVDSFGVGHAGQLDIQANTATLLNGALVSSSAFSQGNGGQINLSISDTISVSGRRSGLLTVPFAATFENNDTGVNSSTFSTGNAGTINLQAQNLLIADGGDVATSSIGKGAGGEVVINAENIQISRTGSVSSSAGFLFGNILPEIEGKAGNIFIQAKQINLKAGGLINSTSMGKNDAGSITIQVDSLVLEQNSSIQTAARQATGGNISIQNHDLLSLNRSKLSTSVAVGQGGGGNISIDNPEFIVMNNSQIIAQADAGQGGNIRIVAAQFLKSTASLVSASSRLGIDGNIEITPPDETVSGGLLNLNNDFVKRIQIRDACKTAIAGQLPTEFQLPLTFVVDLYHFPNNSIEDWIPSYSNQSELASCL